MRSQHQCKQQINKNYVHAAELNCNLNKVQVEGRKVCQCLNWGCFVTNEHQNNGRDSHRTNAPHLLFVYINNLTFVFASAVSKVGVWVELSQLKDSFV